MAAGPAAADPKGDNTVSEIVVIANRPPSVDELTVVARAECLPPIPEKGSARPRVVSTYPRQNEEIRPGLAILRVTFDTPMACSGFFAMAPGMKNPCSSVVQNFLMSYDHKTIRVPCVVRPGERYTLWLNAAGTAPAPIVGPVAGPAFTSLQGQLLPSHHMTFAVSAAAPIETIPDALSADPDTVLADLYRPAQKARAMASGP
jgi:hypothetical protein